jgi:hypothetical protein
MVFCGQCPASLEVADRSDNCVRLKIEHVGTSASMVIDLEPAETDALIAELRAIREEHTA